MRTDSQKLARMHHAQDVFNRVRDQHAMIRLASNRVVIVGRCRWPDRRVKLMNAAWARVLVWRLAYA